jgi:Transcriptional regulator
MHDIRNLKIDPSFELGKNNLKIKSIVKAFYIIDIVSDHKDGLSLTKISKSLQISVSSTHHLVSTLVGTGFLKQDETTKTYKLGLKTLEIGNKYLKNLSFASISAPYLKKIQSEINETVNLTEIEDMELVVIETLNTSHTIRPFQVTVAKDEYHASALGKIVLSSLSEIKLLKYIENVTLKKYTSNTIIKIHELREALENIKRDKISYDNEELEDGLFCIAVPIYNLKKIVIGAIGVSIPKQRYDLDKKERVSDLLKKISLKLSSGLGYMP